MTDLYESLLGSGAPDKSQQAQVAASLRRRRAFGELGVLTGDQALQSFGSDAIKSADKQVSDFQNIRQKDIDNAQTEKYQTGQLKHMDETLAETKRNNDMENKSRLLMAMAALTKAERTGAAKQLKMTYADRNKLEVTSQLVHNGDELNNTFDDSFTQKLGAGPQSKLPNAMASIGLGTEGSKKAANWWAQWNQIYTLPQRNKAFGATLTPHERQAWAESDINPTMDAKIIRERAANIMKMFHRAGGQMDREYRTAGVDPNLMDVYDLGDGSQPDQMPQQQAPGPGGAPMPQPQGPPPGGAPMPQQQAPKRIRVDAEGNPI
jgi:hypothetical protein